MLDKSSRVFQYVCQLYIVPRWFGAALVQARVSGGVCGGAVVGEGCEGLLTLVEAANETNGKLVRRAAGGWRLVVTSNRAGGRRIPGGASEVRGDW